MDSFNKVLSFVLGIVAVIILLLVLTRRVNRSNTFSLLPFSARNEKQVVTPAQTSRTPVRAVSSTPPPRSSDPQQGQTKGGVAPTRRVTTRTASPTIIRSQGQAKGGRVAFPSPTFSASVKTIPKTGSPTALTLIMSVALLSGIYLRRRI